MGKHKKTIKERYTDINAKAIDNWVAEGWDWGIPVTREEYLQAKNGLLDVVLTPTISVPAEWFAPYLVNKRLDGVHLLGLASGGGQLKAGFIFSAIIIQKKHPANNRPHA